MLSPAFRARSPEAHRAVNRRVQVMPKLVFQARSLEARAINHRVQVLVMPNPVFRARFLEAHRAINLRVQFMPNPPPEVLKRMRQR